MPTATPARTRGVKPSKDYADIHIISREDESFRARIFDSDEIFTFSTDVNAFLMLNAFSGEAGAITSFMLSLIEIEVDDNADTDDIEIKRAETRRKFTDLLAGQKGLTIKRLIKFVGDLTDAAGNGSLE